MISYSEQLIIIKQKYYISKYVNKLIKKRKGKKNKSNKIINHDMLLNISSYLNEIISSLDAAIRLENGFQGYLLPAFISHDTIAMIA